MIFLDLFSIFINMFNSLWPGNFGTTFLQGDASKKTGCFDLTCAGFVQISKEIALGAAIYPISIPGGLSYKITIYIYKVSGMFGNNYFRGNNRILFKNSQKIVKLRDYFS